MKNSMWPISGDYEERYTNTYTCKLCNTEYEITTIRDTTPGFKCTDYGITKSCNCGANGKTKKEFEQYLIEKKRKEELEELEELERKKKDLIEKKEKEELERKKKEFNKLKTFNEKLNYLIDLGFVFIPFNRDYLINKEGIVISIKAKNFLQLQQNYEMWYDYRLYKNGKYKSYTVSFLIDKSFY